MRCLYCGIRLKIAEKGQMIQHCPECSVRREYESGRDVRGAQDRRGGLRQGKGRRLALAASTMSA